MFNDQKDKTFPAEETRLRLTLLWLSKTIKELERDFLVLHEREVSLKASAWEERLDLKSGANQADNALLQSRLREVHGQKESLKQQIARYRALKDKPYFGKIIFSYEGESLEEAEAYYIGLESLYDTQTCESLVIDWRSPLASLYYDAKPGSVTIEGPRGPVRGYLHSKHLISIREGKLLAYEDYSAGMSDEFLASLLARNTSHTLREIAATIQAEQNQIIRQPSHESLLVVGVAGSGKTSIALHRASWLLYKERFSSERILFISPNHLFGDYVMSVLPALGEESLTLKTMVDLELELVEQLDERLATFVYEEASTERLELASRLDLVHVIDDFILNFMHGEQYFVPQDLREIYRLFLQSDVLADYGAGLSSSSEQRRYDRVDLAILARMAQRLLAANVDHQYYYLMIDEAQDLLPLEHHIIRASCVCPTNLFVDFSQAIRFELPESYQALLTDLYNVPADNVYYLRKAYRASCEIMSFAKQIIQESDLIPFERHGRAVQVEKLAAQAEQISQIKDILAGFHHRGARRIAIITRDFQGSKQLREAVRAVSPEDSFRVIHTSPFSAHVQKKLPTLAIESEFLRYHRFPWPQFLQETADQEQNTGEDAATYSSPDFDLFILDAPLAKGLEFDAVLLSDVSAVKYSTEKERRLLYVACTRALHELVVLYAGKASPFLLPAT